MSRLRIVPTALSCAFLLTTHLGSQSVVGPSSDVFLTAGVNTFSETVTVTSEKEPTKADFTVGPLKSIEMPDVQAIASIDTQQSTQSGDKWIVLSVFSGAFPLGQTSFDISFRDHKIATVQVSKSGVLLDRPPTTQSEDDSMLLVLRNPSPFTYEAVRARITFAGKDVCTFIAERYRDDTGKQPTFSKSADCDDVSTWTTFQIPPFTAITLRTSPPHDWFVDNGSRLLRTGKQRGMLTVRFFKKDARKNSQAMDDESIPLEVDFHQGLWTRTKTYFIVGSWLLLGAIASVLLRVAIPNYRRFRSLREELIEVRKLTRGISETVDSILRVQLRVERLSLDTLRKSTSIISPAFSGVALRLESGITTLNRKIIYVRRLDASLNRRALLIANELAPPTRIAAIDRHLDLASEELKSDQFRDEDWVVIQQALEAADKALSEPTEEDKSAFKTSLVERWKNLKGHFLFDPITGWTLPRDIEPMRCCFPQPDSLPKGQDDGSKWIEEIGTVRADLQISALEMIREFEFLAPAIMNDHWLNARGNLNTWLATPALETLSHSRTLLRKLAENIDTSALVSALQALEAQIELEPQSVGSGERVHASIRFRWPDLNSAAARKEIVCEWRISSMDGALQSGTPESAPTTNTTADAVPGHTTSQDNTPNPVDDGPKRSFYYREKGWDIYHYFETFLKQCPIEVRFFFEGRPVLDEPTKKPLVYRYIIDLQMENAAQRSIARKDTWRRLIFETLELCAALLIPLSALAIATSDQNTTGYWWQLVALGFGSDTIRNVLTGTASSTQTKVA